MISTKIFACRSSFCRLSILLVVMTILWIRCGYDQAEYPTCLSHVKQESRSSDEIVNLRSALNTLKYIPQQKLSASDKSSEDFFGYAVALSSDGNTALVGANGKSHDGFGLGTGVAYVFIRTRMVWVEQKKLIPSDVANEDYFGSSVALSSDGSTALVGAYNKTNSGSFHVGASYVYTRSGSIWTEQQKLMASDKASNDQFGGKVALSADGNTALIAAVGKSDIGFDHNGAAYVFARTGTNWTEWQKISAGDKSNYEGFGWSIALSGDGNTALVGAFSSSDGGLSSNGAAYVFTRSGVTWREQQKITASDKVGGASFGNSVSLSRDGSVGLIGCSQLSKAYIVVHEFSKWNEKQKIASIDASIGFGQTVALSAEGDTAVVGAQSSSTYVFSREGTWIERQKLAAGAQVDVSGDGTTVLIGSNQSDSGLIDNGAAFVFALEVPKANGVLCADNADCASGYCVDGVCCNSACGGNDDSDCQGCSTKKGAAVDGTCGPIVAGTPCRRIAGVCDLQEVCSGTSVNCPADKFSSSITVCRPAAGPCDVAEKCSGTTAICPSDKLRPNTAVCRSSAGPCDLAEFCNGSAASCPADQFKPLLVLCRPTVGACDLADYCTGNSPACSPDDFLPSGTVCRPAINSCDQDEICSGRNAVCPIDKTKPDGTPCLGGSCKVGICI